MKLNNIMGWDVRVQAPDIITVSVTARLGRLAEAAEIHATATEIVNAVQGVFTPGVQCGNTWISDNESEHRCCRTEGHPGLHTDASGDYSWQMYQ
jgi:hypothetical protein